MKILRNELLKHHTSLRIGGPADYFCIPKNRAELLEALKFAKEKKLRLAIMGAGTNLLALDSGFRGLVIKLFGGINDVKIHRPKAQVGAGVALSKLLLILARKGLGGLEFLAGIPGSIGGAVYMNAGAWGKGIGNFVEEVRVVDRSGKEQVLNRSQLGFGYRSSKLQNSPYLITDIVLKLRRKKGRLITKKMKEYLKLRKDKQPLGTPNCGSVFKNPKGEFAGNLIEKAGCKGMRIGDAQVSSKHANFILNLGEAKAKDVIKLMTCIRKAVKIELEPEVKILVEK